MSDTGDAKPVLRKKKNKSKEKEKEDQSTANSDTSAAPKEKRTKAKDRSAKSSDSSSKTAEPPRPEPEVQDNVEAEPKPEAEEETAPLTGGDGGDNNKGDTEPEKKSGLLGLFGKGKSSMGNMFRRKKSNGGEQSPSNEANIENPSENDTNQESDPNSVDKSMAGNDKEDELGPMKIFEPIRADPIKKEQQRARRLERLTANVMPELHLLGQIKSGKGFVNDSVEGCMLRYKIVFGNSFEILGGTDGGQTQMTYCKLMPNETLPFNHPIDLHFAQAATHGWTAPRIEMQAYKVDMYGRRILCAYGFAHLPCSAGFHDIEVGMWRPAGTPEQELSSIFLGDTPALASENTIYNAAWKQRSRIISQAAGKVKLEFYVVSRNYTKHTIDVAKQ